MKFIIDFETDSDVNLTAAGAQKYARDPSTRILCMSITDWDTGAQRLWLPGDPPPLELCYPDVILEAHGAGFERPIIEHIAIPRHGWPMMFLTLERWRCSMAACAYHGLPLGLEDAAKVLKLVQQKGKMPRRPWTWEKLCDLYDYCLQDGLTQRELSQYNGELPPEEQRTWEMDQRINERGVYIDQELCKAALDLRDQVKSRLNAELSKLTGGKITTSGQVARILLWLTQHGFDLPDLRADTVTEFLAGRQRIGPITRVLEIRKTLAKSSVAKYQAALNSVCSDGRGRGYFQYHAASTGRWGGRLLQPHNFARPTMKGIDIEDLVWAIKTRDAAYVEAVYGDVFEVFKNAVRGIITAAPGKRLVVGDFSAIEGIANACMSGEEWKIEAYRRGEDMYCTFAEKALGHPVAKGDGTTDRQDVGKPGELAFGFEGAVGAWRKFDKSDRYTDDEVEEFKKSWRKEHPMYKANWKGLNEACLAAVADPAHTYSYRSVMYFMWRGRLACRLPSGRLLWYNEPKIVERLMSWTDRSGMPVYKPAVNVRAWKEGVWKSLDLYGGLNTENTVSGSCRDLLVGAMHRCEAAGIPMVSHVHDEIVAEVDEFDTFNVAVLTALMAEGEPWALGWPITADGWTGPRYHKAD